LVDMVVRVWAWLSPRNWLVRWAAKSV
ncbi:histidine kinase-, DNA gyrase B-, and HSP90-like ATPase family protein, partial [Vibrio parahaemolyticus V-223/04]